MTKLNEAKLGRVWKFIKDSKYSFAIISGYRKNKEPEENQKHHEKLKTFIRDNGYGFLELRGGYSEVNPETGEKFPMSYEDSLLVIDNSSDSQKLRKIALIIAEQLEQDCIIFKEDTAFSLIGTSDFNGVGSVITSFSTVDNNNINMNVREIFQDFFSPFKKGNDKSRKFIFNLQEAKAIGSVNHAYMKYLGKQNIWEDVVF